MGIVIALSVLILWVSHLVYGLAFFKIDFGSVFTYMHMLIQAYLFTGLFITAHDAMHGTISKNGKINKIFGWTASSLFACLSYSRLLKNHRLHHKFPGTENDPDFSVNQNFVKWWFLFMKRYSTILQFVCMGIIYNVLKIFVPELNLIFLWIIPAVLSTFQLFFFGTYIPHRTPHTHEMQPHNARTQKKNFLGGMLSCYFFGFHYEHHHSPGTPWWRLYSIKKQESGSL